MPVRNSALSEEQRAAIKKLLDALHRYAGLTYIQLGDRTGVGLNAVQNFRSGKSKGAPWLTRLARGTASVALSYRSVLQGALPNVDELIETVAGGEPVEREPSLRRRLMREAAEEFLDINKTKAEDVPDRFRSMQYLCYRYSSQQDLIVSTDLRIYPVDPASTLTRFAHLYVTQGKHQFTTVGIVLRQAHNRLVLMGNTDHGTAMFMMVLNEPLAPRARIPTTRKPWDFHYMSGLVMGMNATGNVLASRVLCIPVSRSLPAYHLQADREHVGVWSTADGLDRIRTHLGDLPKAAQKIAIGGLSNAIGEEDVLVLRHAQ